MQAFARDNKGDSEVRNESYSGFEKELIETERVLGFLFGWF